MRNTLFDTAASVQAKDVRVGDYVYYMGMVSYITTLDNTTRITYDSGRSELLPADYDVSVSRPL